MRYLTIALVLSAAALWTGKAEASDLPPRSDIEAVCDKFGPTNKEFCGQVLGLYDAVDGMNSRLGDLESFVGRIPEHPHPAFGYELTQRTIGELRGDMDASVAELEGLIGRVPEHPHPAFGYESTKREIAALRAEIEELRAQIKQ